MPYSGLPDMSIQLSQLQARWHALSVVLVTRTSAEAKIGLLSGVYFGSSRQILLEVVCIRPPALLLQLRITVQYSEHSRLCRGMARTSGPGSGVQALPQVQFQREHSQSPHGTSAWDH